MRQLHCQHFREILELDQIHRLSLLLQTFSPAVDLFGSGNLLWPAFRSNDQLIGVSCAFQFDGNLTDLCKLGPVCVKRQSVSRVLITRLPLILLYFQTNGIFVKSLMSYYSDVTMADVEKMTSQQRFHETIQSKSEYYLNPVQAWQIPITQSRPVSHLISSLYRSSPQLNRSIKPPVPGLNSDVTNRTSVQSIR